MSFIDKLKSVFIVQENQSAKEISEDSQPNQNTNNSTQVNSTSVNPEDTKKFIDILFNALEKANIPGFDYLEFMQSIDNLKKQNITEDETKLFQSAFAFASTLKVDKQTLLASAQKYLNVLEVEKTNFNDSLNNNAKLKLEEKNNQLKSLDAEIQSNKKNIADLQAKITKDEELKNNLVSELAQAENKVNSIKMGFSEAYSKLSEKLKSDITKINNYL